jgi:hypothetical protein
MRTLGLVLAAALVAAGALPAAASVDPQCILDAQARRKACHAECRNDYFEAKDLCRNVDPVCGANCRQQRTDCLAPLLASLDACLDDCQADLETAKGLCPPPGDPGRDACIDAAQVAAFICRDDCRERWRADPVVQLGRQFCREQFRACMRGCPPPPAP